MGKFPTLSCWQKNPPGYKIMEGKWRYDKYINFYGKNNIE